MITRCLFLYGVKNKLETRMERPDELFHWEYQFMDKDLSRSTYNSVRGDMIYTPEKLNSKIGSVAANQSWNLRMFNNTGTHLAVWLPVEAKEALSFFLIIYRERAKQLSKVS